MPMLNDGLNVRQPDVPTQALFHLCQQAGEEGRQWCSILGEGTGRILLYIIMSSEPTAWSGTKWMLHL